MLLNIDIFPIVFIMGLIQLYLFTLTIYRFVHMFIRELLLYLLRANDFGKTSVGRLSE